MRGCSQGRPPCHSGITGGSDEVDVGVRVTRIEYARVAMDDVMTLSLKLPAIRS